MKYFLSALAVSGILLSCSNSSEPATQNTMIAGDSALQVAAPANANAPLDAPAIDQAPASGPAIGQSSPSPGSAPATTASGVNPPHGEPGHRCEIAVGAPLNSAPSAPATPPGQSGPVVTPSMPATPMMTQPQIQMQPQAMPMPTPTPAPTGAPTQTAPGMNPPHGEPGHDCSIPVGSPLKK